MYETGKPVGNEAPVNLDGAYRPPAVTFPSGYRHSSKRPARSAGESISWRKMCLHNRACDSLFSRISVLSASGVPNFVRDIYLSRLNFYFAINLNPPPLFLCFREFSTLELFVLRKAVKCLPFEMGLFYFLFFIFVRSAKNL